MYQLSKTFCSIRHLIAGCVSLSPYHLYYNHLFCYMYLFHLFLYIVLIYYYFLNKLQALVWGCTEISGGVSQALKWGYERYVAVHAWQGMGYRLGTLADVQASLQDSPAHAWRFFPPKCRSRWQWHCLVMSLMSFLHISRGGIKGSVHKTQGSVSQSFLCSFIFIWFFWLVPQLVCLASHRPSYLAILVPLEEWNYNQTGRFSLFVQLFMLKVILGTLSWCALVFL